MNGEKKGPISIEDIIKIKEAKEAETSKPVFLTKAQRRENALKARQAEVESQKQNQSSLSSSSRQESRNASSLRLPVESSEDCFVREKYDPREREKELEQIRLEKLGLVQEKKRKITKPSERLVAKVTYWDDEDDTTAQDYNSVYAKRVEMKPQFGRGSLAGMGDIEEEEENNRDYSRRGHGSHQGREDYGRDGLRRDGHGRDGHGRDGHGRDGHGRSSRESKESKALAYWARKPLSEMSSRDWRIFREDNSISTKGSNVPNPIRNWNESNLPDWAMRAIKDAEYRNPTPIQMQAIPIGLQGRDLIGIAETGSGKTAAFLLPLLVHISKLPKLTPQTESDGPYALILAPTRELALQIKLEADKFAKYADCRSVLCIGGEDLHAQVAELRKGCEIVVATTGRLVDLISNAWIVLNQCHYVVLDEGDRMIDMGFEEQLLQILEAMPKHHLKSTDPQEVANQEKMIADSANTQVENSEDQSKRNIYRTTVLFSATMPPPIERIANKYLRNPAIIYVGEVGRTVDRIKQNVEWMKSDSDKRKRLQELLLHGPKPPIIVFMNQKKNCDLIAKFISKFGFNCVVLHSGKTQEAREWAIAEFKSGAADILVATNVAGRGLDVKGVTHVINYDLPESIDEYTHRIGRTGRAGMEGLATSFLTQNDEKIMAPLRQMLQKTNNKIPRELSDRVAASSVKAIF